MDMFHSDDVDTPLAKRQQKFAGIVCINVYCANW